jgi:hypothetical protein
MFSVPWTLTTTPLMAGSSEDITMGPPPGPTSHSSSLFNFSLTGRPFRRQQPPPPASGPAEAGPSQTKRKRSDNDTNPGPSGPKKPRNQQPVSRTSRRSKTTRKTGKRPSDWHLKKGEVPKDSEKTKVCPIYCLFKVTLINLAF